MLATQELLKAHYKQTLAKHIEFQVKENLSMSLASQHLEKLPQELLLMAANKMNTGFKQHTAF